VERICAEFVKLAASLASQPDTPIAHLAAFQEIRRNSSPAAAAPGSERPIRGRRRESVPQPTVTEEQTA
jgi:hypothetical protein